MSPRHRIYIGLACALALIAYVLPWVHNPGAGLTVNAYDLAEWTTLHPAVRSADLPYLPSFALRGQLLVITVILALNAPRRFTLIWWLHAIGVLLLGVAQLPPLEFVTQPGDGNYQQQALLAATSLIVAGIALLGWLSKIREPVIGFLCVVAIASVFFAVGRSIDLMQGFSLPAERGLGSGLMLVVYVVLGAWALLQAWQQVMRKAAMHANQRTS